MRSLSAILLLLVFSVVSAAEIFVSPQGKDSNPGTAKAPLKSIEKAIARAAAGDTVKLLPGIYRESVTVKKSGAAGKPLTIMGSRAADGTWQAIVEPRAKTLDKWVPAPEIAANVWKTSVAQRPDLVLMDGWMIAQINKFNMKLARRKPLPEILTGDILCSNPTPGKTQRLAGLDLLALKQDLRVDHTYLHNRKEPFWETLNYVLCGWKDGVLYLRLADGSTPDKHNFTITYGSGITLHNVEYVTLKNLFLRGSTKQVHITGKSSHIIVEDSLMMHGSRRVKVEKTSSDITVRNNIMTCGFTRRDLFGQPSSKDARPRLTYLIFKYIIGVSTSDDASVEFFGDNCHIYNNVIFDGLCGVDGGGAGAKVYHNAITRMSSVGLITGHWFSGEYFENVVSDCGILLRIHDWRHFRFYRTEYHYRNLFMQERFGGSVLHFYGAPWTGEEKMNYDGTRKYKLNPPAPFDPGKVFIYHNTFVGGKESGTIIPTRVYSEIYRSAMPVYIINNIIKTSNAWGMAYQEMLNNNVMYSFKENNDAVIYPKDKNVGKANLLCKAEQKNDIWVDVDNKELPDVRLKAASPALEAGVDVSREFSCNNVKSAPLPGFKPGYFKGKAPAAGALQAGDDELMEVFRRVNQNLLKAEELLKKQR